MHLIIRHLLHSAKKRQTLAFRLRNLMLNDRQEGLAQSYKRGKYHAYSGREI